MMVQHKLAFSYAGPLKWNALTRYCRDWMEAVTPLFDIDCVIHAMIVINSMGHDHNLCGINDSNNTWTADLITTLLSFKRIMLVMLMTVDRELMVSVVILVLEVPMDNMCVVYFY